MYTRNVTSRVHEKFFQVFLQPKSARMLKNRELLGEFLELLALRLPRGGGVPDFKNYKNPHTERWFEPTPKISAL